MKVKLTELEARLQERLLLARAVPGDRLMLADVTLLQALEGTRPLTPAERTALQGSPLTLRRFRLLAQTRHALPAENGLAGWRGSHGLLRAAASDMALATLHTEDGYWTLDLVATEAGWQVVLAVQPEAPFAAQAMQQAWTVQVRDGQGQLILQGSLDSDGECEARWPHAGAPSQYFQQHGAAFVVQPLGRP